jgi:hypothetical protein
MKFKFDMWVDNDVPNWFPTLNNFYRLPFSKWPPQYRTNSTLSDFNDMSYVSRLWCPELAVILKMADILKILKRRIAPLMVTYHYVKFYISIIIHLEVISQCMSRIDSRHWKISTARYFQNGRHNTAKIQHCEITSKWIMIEI